jgi:hypothetical protein
MEAGMSSTAKALTLSTAAAVLGVSLGGCALLFVSTDGLSGAAEAPGDSGVSGEAASEASTLDAATDVATATDSSDGAVPAFCASNPGHTFCDDFDDREDVTVGWQTDQGGRCTGSADVTFWKSPPRSARADIPAGDAIASYAHIGRSFGTTTMLRVSFDIFVTPPSGDVGDSLGTVSFPQGYFDIVWYTSGSFVLTERTSNPNVDHAASVKLPSGKWARLEIETTPGHLRAKVDGVVAIDTSTTGTFSGVPALYLGLFAEDTKSIAANYDNVLVDTSF